MILDDLLNNLDDLLNNLDAAIDAGLEAAAEEAAQVARSKIHNVSGNLAKSIEVRKTGRHTFEIDTDEPYARYVENGRGAVRAKGGGMLRFFVGGREIRKHQVGPAAARPFMKPARTHLARMAAKHIEEAIDGR